MADHLHKAFGIFGDLGDQLPLCPFPGTEEAGTADINQQYHRHLPLLLVDLHIRSAQSGGHVPVHGTRVIAILVLPHLAEGHTTAFEGAVILPGEDLVRQGPGTDLYLADLLEELVS